MHSEVFGNALDKVTALHGPGFTTAFLFRGRCSSQSSSSPVDADLANDLELSCEGLGLTDTLLGNGQYGQTLLVSGETTLQNDLHNICAHCSLRVDSLQNNFLGPI